jgi:hypothetical protein
VVVSAPGFRAQSVAVAIDPGKVADVDVTLEPDPAMGK